MIRRWFLGVVFLLSFTLLTACDNDWQTLGTVVAIKKGSHSSRVFLDNGTAYSVDTELLSDCVKGSILKRAGFLYSCW